jgi:hypothetical protein
VSVTVSQTLGFSTIQPGTQLPSGDTVPLAASAQAGHGQALFFDASGNAALNDGSVPGLVCAGFTYPAKLSVLSTTAAASATMVHQGFATLPDSTTANDSFSAADQCVVAFDSGNGVPGKLSNLSGASRSIMGLVFGVDDTGDPRVWAGPVASAVARAVLIAKSFPLAQTEIADAAASDTIAEKAISRPKIKGTVTSIEFTGAAIAADITDYITVTVSKRDGAGGAAVVLGTYDSRAANQGAVTAFTPAAFSLSVVAGALYLLESDVVTVTVAKGGSGKVITGAVLVNGKAI